MHHFCGIPDKNTYPVSTQKTDKPQSSDKPKLRDSHFVTIKNVMDRDLPGGPLVKNLPSNAEVTSLIPGQELGSYLPPHLQ